MLLVHSLRLLRAMAMQPEALSYLGTLKLSADVYHLICTLGATNPGHASRIALAHAVSLLEKLTKDARGMTAEPVYIGS